MRVVFMGTPSFGVPSLRALAASHEVLAAYCQPDRPSGRGRDPVSSPVKRAALELGITVEQPARLGEADVAHLAELAPDVICVAAFGQILSQELLDVPRFGVLNVHASLLPRHRGAAPIERAILEGDLVTGVSIMRVEAALDSGPVASVVEVPIGDHTATTLAKELAAVGAAALVDVVDRLEGGAISWTDQDDDAASYAAKITKESVALSPELSAADALRRIRASSRRFPSRLRLCGAPATVSEAVLAPDADTAPGTVATGDRLLLGFSDGALEVVSLRPENRAEMSGEAFVCGLRDAERVWGGLS